MNERTIMNDQPSPINQTPPVVAEFHPAERDDGEAPTQVYDCWNTIGVAGNGSCQELLRFVHCRNCPVYSAATPAKTSVVIFRIASEWLALPTHAFQEVTERRAMHSLPHRRRDLVLGLVNVRGELLVCVSLGRWLGLAGLGTSDEWRVRRAAGALPVTRHPSHGPDRLLVANWGGNRIAFPVGEVHGINRVHWEKLHEPPATIAKSMNSYSRGVFAWRDHTVGFLDADALFAALNRSLT